MVSRLWTWRKRLWGSSANKIKESDTVLKIGMLIKNNLEKNNEKVITTREKRPILFARLQII